MMMNIELTRGVNDDGRRPFAGIGLVDDIARSRARRRCGRVTQTIQKP